MIKFFRKFRQKLLSENKFSKYLIYAVGEIILVVIGILIALQVNNQNQIKNEKKALKNYLEKIAINVKSDIKVAEFMMETRSQQSLLCAQATELISKKDWSDQRKITNAVFAMIIEQPLNFNRSGFESLKNSGYLQHLDNSEIEELIYNYYNSVDKVIFEETSLQVWANDLDLELHKSGFFSSWLELEKRPNQKMREALGNYTDMLTEHKGNDIVLSILYRGFLFTAELTGFYEEQVTFGNELLTAIENYNN
ncbi:MULTISPECIES: hypothetical protein [Flavobacteriaceae]|uniref:Uncharacterized protein n=1 Tax=Ichthyenterobacterium magnum TaxID=1230530 RepID=A0A420DC11_9FLAO|nr:MULTISPECIES: hypothetical protein [Flavobacteriaceae]RKE89073.1 hypothetical protein BXY80_2794 [Ichthyenterobacterium magnum]